MTVLITGGAGFIGSHLAENLVAEGYRVICIDDFNDYYDPRIKWENIAGLQARPEFRLVKGDITNKETLEELFSAWNIDQVVHLAARAGVRPSLRQPALYEKVNVGGTINLLEQCVRHQVKKFIFGSSSSVYGEQDKIPFSEEDRIERPISPYAATKRAAELICYTYHHLYQLPVICLRFFTVYGPRQRPEMAIHKFTSLIYQRQPIPLYGDGSSSRDYTFISDIVSGLRAAMDRNFGYEIINLGNSSPIQLKELVRLIEEALGLKARIDFQPPQSGDVTRTYADISKAQKLLGYHPEVPIEEGVALFVDWFKRNRPCPAAHHVA
ncbi:UDP-glucuronate 4-epimerase [Candidatus Hakubella thermalkaliphila]|uniref:UDP-glucuronate 4-epimerase n=1 Tax=Candidatus Hakubella thermalkaliphila TaxID=2754717 RepID=A0A6V8NFC7_9ACTN|nr:GDP-mannose 4,6-dehydratase [Candidatus Hakubella thermalkaliphila]GFP18972.1 UDP-glucuronate 4-epimerase [Candidatus Hakubella thermalkaliphila]GFP30728.1 UDP-glucuronate 4-epimerase [Candidatus Hakubella thermalkaliphila]